MKMNRMLIVAVASLGAAGWGMAAHADAKAKFASDCAECHEAGDFEGEDAKALADYAQEDCRRPDEAQECGQAV